MRAMRSDRGSIPLTPLSLASAASALARLQLHVLGLQGGRFGIGQRYQLIAWADRVRTLPVSRGASAALISLMIERSAIARRMVVVPYRR